MIPWPAKLLELYPRLAGSHPQRPWWTFDGGDLYRPAYVRGAHRVSSANADDLLGVMEQVDREKPLPHPGFRCGQIWGATAGGSVQLVAVDSHGLAKNIDDTDSPHVVNFMPGFYPFLVHDTVCPWLAPWSPVEKKP